MYHFESPLGSYKYNHVEAIARCEDEGMSIATLEQLQVAWQNGMEVCACGWLSDGSVRYPVQYPRPGCGSSSSGIVSCSEGNANVYCFKN